MTAADPRDPLTGRDIAPMFWRCNQPEPPLPPVNWWKVLGMAICIISAMIVFWAVWVMLPA